MSGWMEGMEADAAEPVEVRREACLHCGFNVVAFGLDTSVVLRLASVGSPSVLLVARWVLVWLFGSLFG